MAFLSTSRLTVSLVHVFAEVARLVGVRDLSMCSLEMAFAPEDLVARCYAHHAACASAYTFVEGFPQHATPEIFQGATLEYLATTGLPIKHSSPGRTIATLGEAERRSGYSLPVNLRTEIFNAATSYGISSTSLTRAVALSSLREVDVARRVIVAVADDGETASGLDFLRQWRLQSDADMAAETTGIKKAYRRGPKGAEFSSTCAHRPKRILYISQASGYSGAQTALYMLLRGLDRSRYSPTLLVGRRGHFSRQVESLGCQVVALNEDKIGFGVTESVRIMSAVDSANPDLIHFNGFEGTIPVAYAVRLGVPTVQHLRLSSLDQFAHQLIWADVNIAVSNHVRSKALATEGVAPERVRVVYDGIDTDLFSPGVVDRERARRELGLDPNAWVVLHVGRFVPGKRQDVLLRAARRAAPGIPELHLLLIGETHTALGYYQGILSEVETLGLTSRVRIQDFQPDIRIALASSDVLVLCSDDDALGMSLLEAMAMEVPVIVANRGGGSELFDFGISALVVPSVSESDIASSLVELMRITNVARDSALPPAER